MLSNLKFAVLYKPVGANAEEVIAAFQTKDAARMYVDVMRNTIPGQTIPYHIVAVT